MNEMQSYTKVQLGEGKKNMKIFMAFAMTGEGICVH